MGLLGLQIRMPRVRSLISFSNSSIGGSANPFSIESHHRADHGARRNGEGHVVGVGRFGNDDFVARVQARHEGEEHGLGAARGDDDLLGRKLDLVLLVVGRQLFAERRGSRRWDCIPAPCGRCALRDSSPVLGRGEVGLADVQVVDFRFPAARAASASGTSLRIGEAGICSARCEISGMRERCFCVTRVTIPARP